MSGFSTLSSGVKVRGWSRHRVQLHSHKNPCPRSPIDLAGPIAHTIADISPVDLSLAYQRRNQRHSAKCLVEDELPVVVHKGSLRLRFSAPEHLVKQDRCHTVDVLVTNLHEDAEPVSASSSRNKCETLVDLVEVRVGCHSCRCLETHGLVRCRLRGCRLRRCARFGT